MKVFVAGGTGVIGRPLIAELLGKGHAIVALTRSQDEAQALVERGIEPAIADVFDTDAVKAVVSRAQPEVVIEQLTALPKTYTPESMRAAGPFNNRIRLEGGANLLAAARAAGVRRYLRQSIAFWAVPGPGLADEETPLAFDASPAVAADARVVTELEHRLLGYPGIEGIAMRYGFFYGPGTWFNPDGDVALQVRKQQFLAVSRIAIIEIVIQGFTHAGEENMTNPILVTGAAGRVGAVGRTVTELLLKQGKAVRAMVRTEDERAQALRDKGAEVVVGDLLDLDSMHRVIAGCETMYFGMSVSDAYLAATVNTAAVAKHHGVKAFINMSQMTLSQMSITETTASPQHKLQWLSEQALNWSGLPVVHVRPTVFLEGFFLLFTSDLVRESNQIRLPFGEGKTSPVAAEDVARVIASLLANPQPHIGKIYHLTGPQSENMFFYAQEYSKALGRTITYQDIPVEPWRHGLLERGLAVYLVDHLTTMADLHRAGRYDRMSNDVLELTGQGPLSMQDFVRKNAASFTASAKAV